jgi:hypothetical protein
MHLGGADAVAEARSLSTINLKHFSIGNKTVVPMEPAGRSEFESIKLVIASSNLFITDCHASMSCLCKIQFEYVCGISGNGDPIFNHKSQGTFPYPWPCTGDCSHVTGFRVFAYKDPQRLLPGYPGVREVSVTPHRHPVNPVQAAGAPPCTVPFPIPGWDRTGGRR